MCVEWSSDSIFLEGIAPTWGVQVVDYGVHWLACFLSRRPGGGGSVCRKLPKSFFGSDSNLDQLKKELIRVGEGLWGAR
jgi:hypothetical protein